MENKAKQVSLKGKFETPVRITKAEPWQWQVLAKAFLPDPTLNFWLGEKTDEKVLGNFFEAVIKDTLESGGMVFSTSDQKAVIVWTRLGYTLESPTAYKKQWYDVLDPEGVKRYQWLYEAGDIPLTPEQLKKSMLPDYLGVLPEAQGYGYGSHLARWTVDHFENQGFDVPFILASTRRSAKLYAPLLDFRVHKEVFAEGNDTVPAGVFMISNRWAV